MSIRTQLLKGLLDACVLSIIKEKETYGYELSQKLLDSGLGNISEGTIYPVLLRLQKKELITSEMRISDLGPKRKYYFITSLGIEALNEMTDEWNAIHSPITNLLNGG
ncbi:PadR family transcriptional regulator [Macrococcoides canis]|uniref:PadR family transcriptional regulator n=1 Tax=Macrococcoides canis TaxID=1855823 RepID=UPI001AEC0D0C|nr:PadR family transcriptional regulator [Macrococcus canis]QTQ08157.1 PadR family transcriptional regulator [Macrococcus canis]UTH00144.1 PadR family transcriptional regulator [Macrococcus canis]UTH02496.1 PadR family transcriptional regulator [Macrococcus canis]